MRIFERELKGQLLKAVRQFPSLILSGPRRAGKTFLLRRTFPQASYHLLEDPDVLARVKADPRGWLEEVRTPAIVDEIQHAPELFPYIRTVIDREPRRGRWLLTGSQDFALMGGVSESMAGRAAVLHLAPLSFREIGTWSLIGGGFPEVVLRPRARRLWFSSYVQTYLERDVRSLLAVRDLATFRRFLTLLASRNGQVLNRADLAAPLGVSVPTVSSWLGILETTGHLLLVPPFFENFGKRLIKSPKVYWVDSGLVCFLLGVESEAELARSPFAGSVFEGFVGSEVVKSRHNRGLAGQLYFFRDEQGLEVDFVTVEAGGGLHLIEAKWAKTIHPQDARPLQRLMAAVKNRRVQATIVHRPLKAGAALHTVAPGVRAVASDEFLSAL
jgi:predicted AAA+ superfamily ATPase